MRHPETEEESSPNTESPEMVNGKAFFKEFDVHTAAKLLEIGTEARFEPGTLIFEGHDQEESYYITSGSVALEQPAPEQPIRVQTFREGGFLGWGEFLGSGTRHLQARALTAVTALRFNRHRLRKTSECNPRFGYALMRHFLA